VADLDPVGTDREREALGGEPGVEPRARRLRGGARPGAADLDLARRREEAERAQTCSG
jgi:hypothetical protein